jgi:hypothetical protein
MDETADEPAADTAMPGRSAMSRHLRQLLLELCRMEQVVVAYRCECGQRLILTNFEPSVLDQRTRGLDLFVLCVSDQVACPVCGLSLAPVWQAAEMTWVEETLAKLAHLDAENLVWALQVELREREKALLKCN